MSKKLNVILGAYGHLPSGAGEADFEALYEGEIKPLSQALNKFPVINVVFHYSGVVLNWIERRHPEFFMLVEDLLSRKQAEFLGGGFYNPVMPLLVHSDKVGQIEMLTTYLRKHFKRRPRGCWFPQAVWDQSIVGALNSSEMHYALLDDQQFAAAGAQPNAAGLFSPCVTEYQGKTVTVFPIASALGRELREKPSVNALLRLLDKLPDGESLVMLCPFGRWAAAQNDAALDGGGNGTSSCERFLSDLSSADPRIEFTTPSKLLNPKSSKSLKNLNTIYFPGVWASAKSDGEIHPRQFIAKHPEASGMYAKMVYVHSLIKDHLRGDKTRKITAIEELWKAQDSGVFYRGRAFSPGILHAPVRKAAYRALIEAEKITREKSAHSPSLSVCDFNLRGEEEYIFQDNSLNCYIKPCGASIFEMDYLPAAWNYLDTLSDTWSDNVSNTVPNGGGKNQHVKRAAFADWLVPATDAAGSAIEHASANGISGGRFCGNENYDCDADKPRRRLCFNLPPKAGMPCGEIGIEKTWLLKKNILSLEYVLRNSSERNSTFAFCPQIDLAFPGEGEGFLRILAQSESGKDTVETGGDTSGACIVRNIKALEFQDIKNEALIMLEASRAFDVRISHVYADVYGRREYQSTCTMPFFSVSLEGNKQWKVSFSLKINS
ncbi:MAG: DUF1925 domain-containing protein, partial [Treponema sp.]|nr:DUF1925 domain-containing protein [Treponema sp.]